MTESSCKINVWSIFYLKYMLSEEMKPRHRSYCHWHPHWQSQKKSDFWMLWKTRICLQVKTARDCYWKLEGLLYFHLEQLEEKWTLKVELDLFTSRIVWCDCMWQHCSRHSDTANSSAVITLSAIPILWVIKQKAQNLQDCGIGPSCKLNFTVFSAAAIPLLLGKRLWKGK